ncbi:hypothetical protein [Hydrogenimonas sp. SS33]|uniref:hypothetical protein n=1 Tax=Hydrogenimonas leucolamina TaxID=2954236 RepID=UPI00336BD799
MKSAIRSKNPVFADKRALLMWGSFAAGFLWPPLFLLFLWLGIRTLWREAKREYAQAASYMKEESAKTLEACERCFTPAPRGRRAAPLSFAAV